MKSLCFSLVLLSALAGCTCEDPPFLIPGNPCDSEFPYIVYPPASLLIRKDIDLNNPPQELITVVFSEPMDQNTASLNKNIFVNTQTGENLSGVLEWKDPKTLVFKLNGSLPEYCLGGEGCEIVIAIRDDPSLWNLFEEVLDADCDNEQGGSQFTSFYFF